jgi:hypothetical protein
MSLNFLSGHRMFSGEEINKIGTTAQPLGDVNYTGFLYAPAAGSIMAHAGGGQGSATALTASVNTLTTVASAGDSVLLPSLPVPTGAAAEIVVINRGAASSNVFCPSGGSMNGTSNGSSALAAGSVGLYVCTSAGVYFSK